ncbi:C-type lectin domain family 4 member E [Astyanax mexicanus]|uniref:C-type lectin domain family 4 member E n=1 Tax=Astyanax mexicanus TaxID=7994 RepID=UPI0020CB1BDB|nr:C-type lectin domain family 4 member E [Astyanax mexicanus]
MTTTVYEFEEKMKMDVFTIPVKKAESTLNKCMRISAGCLGLLCVLQAATITTLCLKHMFDKEHLQNTINNLTIEKDLLQTSYTSLTTAQRLLQSENQRIAQKFNHLGWRYFNSSIYYTSTEKKTWAKSRQHCRTIGADLVIINTKEEQIFVSGFSREDMWIGLTDEETEGVWKWVDNTTQTLGYWMEDQPNNFNGNQNCASIQTTGINPLRTWNDYQCSYEKHWVCER